MTTAKFEQRSMPPYSGILTGQLLAEYEPSSGLLPYYSTADGTLYFGVVKREMTFASGPFPYYDMHTEGVNIHVSDNATDKKYYLDPKQPKKLPAALRFKEVTIGQSNLADLDMTLPRNQTILDKKDPNGRCSARVEFYSKWFACLLDSGFFVSAVEKSFDAAVNGTRLKLGFSLSEKLFPNVEKVTIALPSLRTNRICDIDHIFYPCEISATEAKATSCHWVSINDLDATATQLLEKANTMEKDTPEEQLNHLIILANVHKYVAVILLVATESELRTKWIEKLSNLNANSPHDYYADYDYQALLRRFIDLKISTKVDTSLNKIRPADELTEEAITALNHFKKTNPPEILRRIKFNELLDKIKDKAKEYGQVPYINAMNAAQQLADNLDIAKNTFLAGKISSEIFQDNCLSYIKKFKPELEQHRSWWKQFLNQLVSALVSIATLGVVNLATGKNMFGLFRHSTDGAAKVTDLTVAINSI